MSEREEDQIEKEHPKIIKSFGEYTKMKNYKLCRKSWGFSCKHLNFLIKNLFLQS